MIEINQSFSFLIKASKYILENVYLFSLGKMDKLKCPFNVDITKNNAAGNNQSKY